jgi:hypothetical protein
VVEAPCALAGSRKLKEFFEERSVIMSLVVRQHHPAFPLLRRLIFI